MDLMANTLLSAGASLAMVRFVEEIPDSTPASMLCTLTSAHSLLSLFLLCSELGIPWVLDPVAVSASSFQFDACVQLVGFKPTIIGGNAYEIIALSYSTKILDCHHTHK
ncbi:hypothetical protein RYX36_012472, partial [Vicia faba]